MQTSLAADPLRGLTFPTADEVAQAFERRRAWWGSLYPGLRAARGAGRDGRVRARRVRRVREPHGGGGHGRGQVHGVPGAGRAWPRAPTTSRWAWRRRRTRCWTSWCTTSCLRSAEALGGLTYAPLKGLHALSLPAPRRPPGGRKARTCAKWRARNTPRRPPWQPCFRSSSRRNTTTWTALRSTTACCRAAPSPRRATTACAASARTSGRRASCMARVGARKKPTWW